MALFRFDVAAVFECDVEFGQTFASAPAGPQAERAADRLISVLNPRQDRFPSEIRWVQGIEDVWDESWARYLSRQDPPRPGWSQELELADHDAETRQALLTIGLGLA